jgi:hypothetical protein
MNRFVPSVAALGLLALASSCSTGAKPVLADVAWALTCSGTQPANCNPLNVAGKNWDYIQSDGELAVDERTGVTLGVVDARCSATDIGSGNVRLGMRATVANAYLDIENLDVSRTTGVLAGASCRTTVYDGISTFGGSVEGKCSATAPATGSPCQVTNVTIDPDDMDGPSVELRLLCSALPNTALPSSRLSVRDSSDVAQPALVRFANCRGL